ncbi:MAG: hypothetical protein MHPSP_001354 [Paramarteilia canceri]
MRCFPILIYSLQECNLVSFFNNKTMKLIDRSVLALFFIMQISHVNSLGLNGLSHSLGEKSRNFFGLKSSHSEDSDPIDLSDENNEKNINLDIKNNGKDDNLYIKNDGKDDIFDQSNGLKVNFGENSTKSKKEVIEDFSLDHDDDGEDDEFLEDDDLDEDY